MKPGGTGGHTAANRTYALLVVVLFTLFGLGLHVLAPTFNGIKISGLPLGYWNAAQIGPVGLALLFVWLSTRNVIRSAKDSAPKSRVWVQAAAAAAGWCPAVLFIGVSGLLITQGHDGLAYTLGVSGAALLWAALVVPSVSSQPGAEGIPGYLAMRHASPLTGMLSSIVVLVAFIGLLAAEMIVLSGVLGLAGLTATLSIAAAIAATGVGFALAASGRALANMGAAFAGLVVVVLLISLSAVSYGDGPGALVSIPSMANIASFEQTLLENRLADPATFKPHAVPFLRTDVLNFAYLIVLLSAGLSLLANPRAGASFASANHPNIIAGRALLFVTATLVLLPPLAAAAKRALLALFASGVRPASLPDWTSAFLQSGTLQICGSTAADPTVVAKACGKGVGPQGLMRWQEAVFDSDALLFAGLHAGSPAAATILIIALVALAGAAVIWTARRISVLTMEAATPHLVTPGRAKPAAAVILFAAAIIAWAKPAAAVTLMTWSATLAAAGLAPAMFSAIFGRKPDASAANAAILAGSITALAVILSIRYTPIELAQGTGALASAPPNVTRRLSTLQETWRAAAPGPGKDVLRAQAEKLARDNLNWFGVKPVAAGGVGMILGGIIILAGAVVTSVARRKAS